MFSHRKKILGCFLAVVLMGMLPPSLARAATWAAQVQLEGGFGVLVGAEGLGAFFYMGLEPEFFFTKHATLSLRLDGTVGDVDTFGIGPRFRYYFDIPSAPR